MNNYKVSYSLFDINDRKTHFSNCKSTIKGDTFDDAVEKFKQKQLDEGWAVAFLVEGDMFTVTFVDR
jgi:precorrin-2 methylase